MIIVRSPLRISFAGGGTDIRNYYSEGYGAVCSMAIDKYVYTTLNNLADFFPHRLRVAYSQTELAQNVDDVKHPIVREALKQSKTRGGIDLNFMADIPAGTGMGSSSTFAVSLLHALHAHQNEHVGKEQIAEEACRLEIDILKEPIGKQDQYAAAFGGINLFRFFPDERVSVEPLPISHKRKKELVSHLMIFYLGGNREASKILHAQGENRDANRMVLNEMRDQALSVASLIVSPEPITKLGPILQRGWELKRSLASGIANAKIDNFLDRAIAKGALGGKILGAGGTGFLMLLAHPDTHDTIREELSELKDVNFEIDRLGSTLLYYGE